MNLLRIYWQGMVQTFRNPQVRKLLVLIFVTIGAATVFYHFQEHWGWIDALYFSVITISTVGYGDFHRRRLWGNFLRLVIFCADWGCSSSRLPLSPNNLFNGLNSK